MNTEIASQSVGEKSYAGIVIRAGAYLIDCVILFICLIAWQAVLFAVNPIVAIFRSGRQPTGTQLQLWVFATATIPFLIYFVLMLRSARQATLGMRLFKIKVAGVDGGRVRFGRALLRSAVMLIPFELNHAVMFHLAPRDAPPSTIFWLGSIGIWLLIAAYIISILVTRRRQSVHDLVARTTVERMS